MKKHCALILLLLSVISTLGCAYPNMIVEHYTTEDGLPNDIVNCTLKGKDGFVWFGTWYGLCSFDGSKFRSYESRNDLYSADILPRKIQRIVEDKNGFLWIKTVDRKLYLFDKRYESFRAVYNDVKDYSENIQIIKIQTTEDGDVLLLTKDKSLLRAYTDINGKITIQQLHDSRPNINTYDMRLKHNILCESSDYINWIGMDYQIHSLRKGSELKNKPADFLVKKISTDMEGFTCAYQNTHFLWLGTDSGEIYCLDVQTGTVNRYSLPEINKPVHSLLVTLSGIMYFTTDDGAFEYNIGFGNLKKLPVASGSKKNNFIFSDQYDKIWFKLGDYNLLYYDPLNQSSTSYTFPKNNAIGDFDVQDAGEQGMFFLTPTGEVLLFDREKKEMIPVNQMKPMAEDEPNQFFLNILYNKDGTLWLASASNGVYKVNFPKKQFHLLEEVPSVPAELKNLETWNHGVRALYQAKNGDIWVGTRWKTLYCLDKDGHIKHVFSEKNYLLGSVYHIMEDLNGNLWFSTKGNGLIKAEPDVNAPHGLRFTRYKYDPKNRNSISGNDVYFTYQDKKGHIWVGLLGGGLNLLVEEQGTVVFKHKHNGLGHYPPYGLYMDVRTMVEDESGRIWVGTMDGLMSFDTHFKAPEEINFETYRQSSNSSNVADNDIYVLYKDNESQIWVSVFGGGLNKLVGYDEMKREPVFKSYGLRDGMNNDVVKSIVEDKNGNLWFSTEIGLSCFNKATEQFRNYDKYDGFLNVDLEEGCALLTLNGDVWLGCRQGILCFTPEKLDANYTTYDTRIVDFKVSNRDLRSFEGQPQLSVTYSDEVRLNYNQSMFTIEFAALNFYNQNRVTYRYILKGYENEWHHNGKNRIASYTNVPSGTYTFFVEAIDEANPGLVSNSSLSITIFPPWWLSWWAISIYVILGLVAFYFGLRLSFFMIKMKNDIYIEQKVSEMKIKFFTNISHELRTPLTLIKGPLQELKERETLSPKGLQYIELMEKNMNQMIQLVNQLLDFRKIQNRKMRLHVSLIDFNEMVSSFQQEFQVLSEENEISFSFQLSDSPIMLWVDREKIGIVIRNILSNAFKFTSVGGSIHVVSGLTEDGKSCFVRIEDNGIGIPHNKQLEIFERFAQGDNAQSAYYQGTGIGLAFSKEIVNLHHGTIQVESQENHGSAFTVTLLLGKEHYRASEVDFYMDDTEAVSAEIHEEDSSENPVVQDIDKDTEANNSLPTLLLVEDNKDLCHLVKLQLEDGFNIHIANNGVEGLKKVHLYHPDIVVTDQMMPEMDGLEMLQAIRKDFQISHIPVIILTAKNDEDAKTKAISLGANAYITKPFSKEYLLARIDQLLGERKLFRTRIRLQMEQQEVEDENGYEQYLEQKDVEFLEKIHQVIEENMDNSDFNIDTIAAGIGLSRSAFFKKLKSLTGLAPVELVKDIRLNKSIELIKNTGLSISEIAFAVGFKDSGYYSKCFRKKYNQTPREYMNEWRKG